MQRAKWQEWGEVNRSIFEERYRKNGLERWLIDPLLSLIEPAAPRSPADSLCAQQRRSLRREPLVGSASSRIRYPARQCRGGDSRGWTFACDDRKSRRQSLIEPSLAIISRYASWIATIAYRLPLSVRRLFKLIRKENIDLVHTNTGVILAPGLAARLAGVPHVWHFRDSFREAPPWLWKIYSRYIQMMSDRIIAVSNATAAQFSDRSKVVVIHNGFSLDEFAMPSNARSEFRQQRNIGEQDLVTGCVGRIKWGRKGQEHLIQAAHLLKTRSIISKILIVGSPFPGNEIHLERLKELARELDVQDQIVFTGEVTDAKPAYASMDILVLPSAYPEPFGGVVMEAMSMGLPVIATNLGGSLDQVVEGVTGFLVPPADPRALAGRIELLANDPELRRKMGAAGRERIIENFSLSEMVKKIEAVYDSVVPQETFPG